ncbi:MAG: type II toxin-antitoxin system Phd/YefM family antitoxin [Treponema sp.]|nr:type II toxin-antitoxin system Phd/YefM family antitoxin [Treponema sp.]
MNVQLKTGGKKVIWQLQEAKAMFSEVVKAAAVNPQTITIHGRERAVILSFEKYKRLIRPKERLFDFMQSSPLCDVELELPQRQAEKMREISL